jgi:hypothetical protein
MMKIIIRPLQIFFIIAALATLQVFPGCKTKVPAASTEEQVKEIMPGLLQCYLSKE